MHSSATTFIFIHLPQILFIVKGKRQSCPCASKHHAMKIGGWRYTATRS